MVTLVCLMVIFLVEASGTIAAIYFAIILQNGWLGFLAFLLILSISQITEQIIKIAAKIDNNKEKA